MTIGCRSIGILVTEMTAAQSRYACGMLDCSIWQLNYFKVLFSLAETSLKSCDAKLSRSLQCAAHCLSRNDKSQVKALEQSTILVTSIFPKSFSTETSGTAGRHRQDNDRNTTRQRKPYHHHIRRCHRAGLFSLHHSPSFVAACRFRLSCHSFAALTPALFYCPRHI